MLAVICGVEIEKRSDFTEDWILALDVGTEQWPGRLQNAAGNPNRRRKRS